MSADLIANGGVSGAQPQPAATESPRAKPEPAVLRPRPQPEPAEPPTQTVAEKQAELVEKAKQAADQLNDVMDTFNRGIHFKIHEATKRPYVEVINRNTDEVMCTFPPEELLDVMARLHEVLGMILDTRG